MRQFICGCCNKSNNEGEKVPAICGYKYLCIECQHKFYENMWVSTETTARDSALERKDDKSEHRYHFLMVLNEVNEDDLKKFLVGYDVSVNRKERQAVFGKQHTARQFAKLEKYGKPEIKVEDTLTGLQTTVDAVWKATDIQSYGGAYKYNWI